MWAYVCICERVGMCKCGYMYMWAYVRICERVDMCTHVLVCRQVHTGVRQMIHLYVLRKQVEVYNSLLF